MNINTWESISIMIGMIIGAGVLGIPFVIAKAGFLTGLFVIIFVALMILLLYLYAGEFILRTKKKHQLTGYAEKYLGKWGKRTMFFAMIINAYGAMIAYLLGIGGSFAAIFGGNKFVFLIVSFAVLFTIIYFGIKAVAGSEFISSIIFIFLMLAIIFVCFPSINVQNLSQFNFPMLLIPFGPILFAFLGFASIPEAAENLKEKKNLKKAIFLAITICAVLYILFSLAVVGVVGSKFMTLAGDSRIATIALSTFLHPRMALVGNLLAIFTMFTSFLAMGLAIKEVYNYDYKIGARTSTFLALLPPFIISLLHITNFIEVISVTGIIAGTLDAILIVLIIHNAKKKGDRKPEYSLPFNKTIGILISLLFILGASYYLLSYL